MMTMKRMETVLKTLWWNKWISQPTSQPMTTLQLETTLVSHWRTMTKLQNMSFESLDNTTEDDDGIVVTEEKIIESPDNSTDIINTSIELFDNTTETEDDDVTADKTTESSDTPWTSPTRL